MNFIENVASAYSILSGGKRFDDALPTWNKWLEVKKREYRDLLELVSSDVHDDFKALALIVLLTPNFKLIPFKHGESFDNNHLSGVKDDLFASQSKALVGFAARCVCYAIDYAQAGKHKEDYLYSALERYNSITILLLAAMQKEDSVAVDLFERFNINDERSFWNMDDASGYNPFYGMLVSSAPLHWKELADQQMRVQIDGELSGVLIPHEKWEVAIRCYVDHIESAIRNKADKYPQSLLCSQIDFLVNGIGKQYTGKLFESWNAYRILERLDGDNLKSLRHSFARSIVLVDRGTSDNFTIYNEDSKKFAFAILNEFETDAELVAKIRILYAKQNVKESQAIKEKSNQSKKESDILQEMM